MKTSRSDRRARRGTLARTAGWLAAGAMLATAAFAPAAAAASPTSMDVACNNIVNGGRSPEYVWTTVDAAGVTAHWATDAAHFDAANRPTVTIRVCVVDANGVDQGAIDQNTENDGSQLFPWSVLNYAADPCPNSALTFGSSADSPAVQTKKSNLVACPAAPAPVDEASPTDHAQPTDAVDEPTDAVDEPTDAVDEPTDAVDEPTDAVDEPTDAVDEPTDAVDEPTDAVDEPTDAIDEPTQAVNNPTDQGTAPTGAVEGIVGTPGLTPPPTDTQLTAPVQGSSDGWRMILVLVAAVVIGSLTFSRPRRARRTA